MFRFLFVLIVLALFLGGVLVWEHWNFVSPGPAALAGRSGTVVEIAPGEKLASISARLQSAGVITSALLFEVGVRLRREGGLVKAGEYALPSRVSMDDLAAILVAGHAIEHKITAAEGLTSQMVVELVNTDPELTGALQPVPDEGTLLPETYFFTRGASRESIIARMRDAQAAFLARAWASRAAGLPFRSPQDAVALASIVEKETAIAGERRHIAAVFLNRLRLGMKLESDPTVIYGITRGYPLGRGIRQSELAAATPYNTYANSGLPPTPICNPGKDSISAALNPGQSQDLYFVADGMGGHAFAATKSVQDRNVAHWRQIESTALRLRPLH